MPQQWTVPAHVIRVVDGDTVVLLLDLGWHVTYEARCRIAGIDAPELSTKEGVDARAYAETLLPFGALVMFVSHSLDKYGRPLGAIQDADGKSFAEEMKAAGHARPMKD